MANLLQNEDSPYLKQHQNDLVNWYPWGKEAFERAKKEDKLIFVSIGYSSCHWCHVMQKESFQNKEIAKKLNENFIAIKVDKEERPDIDRYFQEIFMKMNNKPGGWPLSVFITADKIPIYSATYLPPTPRYGLIGFEELLDILVLKYKNEKEKLIKNGIEVIEALKPKSKIEATKINENLIKIASNQIKQVYDKKFGGFGGAPKFPHTYTLNLAINLYKLTNDNELKEIVINSLNNMLKGGLHDIVEGGFCRYSTEEKWLIPHFEKMTYDNGLIAITLLKAYQAFNQEIYKDIAFKTLDFMIKRMSKKGLFFSASDADSKDGEGRYFIYKFDEVKEKFIQKSINLELLKELNIKRDGNFEGYSIARVKDINKLNEPKIKEALNVLKEIRNSRDYPFIDKKIITSWNSMVIIALFNASKIEKRFLEIAKSSLEALENKMLKGNTLFHSALIDKPAKIEGFFEDYAWFINALISAYEATLDEIYLIKATNLANEAIKRFYKGGFWSIGGDEFNSFEADTDASIPSAVAIMTHNLLTLRSLVESIYEKFAFFTIEVNSYNIMRQPISRPTLTDATIRYIKDDNIIKANKEILKELIGYNFKYPYTLLKVTNSFEIELCTNRGCFGKFRDIEELKREI
ncbi:MAG: thioredoxin domain-containing protein [Epsilonproteobacteria bacterium]|nr:thioredoxin domain-containing protein [Campylobacterota bacterium]